MPDGLPPPTGAAHRPERPSTSGGPNAPATRTRDAAPAGRIALIRHGQTEWSASGRHTSVTDVDLTEAGVQQARGISAILAGLRLHPREILVSPRRRARRTAELAGLRPAIVTGELAEWDYGRYEGLTTPQIRIAAPGWELFADGCPAGESPEQVADRADRLLQLLRERTWDGSEDGGDVVLVCHGHISRVLAVRWVGLPVAAGALIAMDAAAVTVLGHYHGSPIIEHANVVPFATGGTDGVGGDQR